MITGDHVRMIRGALRLSVRQFADMADLSKTTVSEMERGLRRTYAETSEKIREAFAPYVDFIEPVEGQRGAGIVMKWGVKPFSDTMGEQDAAPTGKNGEGFEASAWDEDFDDLASVQPVAPYIIPISDADRAILRQRFTEHPDTWNKLSDRAKAVYRHELGLNDFAS